MSEPTQGLYGTSQPGDACSGGALSVRGDEACNVG
jgi:hypothetical protein